MVKSFQLDSHRKVHNKMNSWWARDIRGIELCRVCDECEHLLSEVYAPEVLGTCGRYEDVVEENIDSDY